MAYQQGYFLVGYYNSNRGRGYSRDGCGYYNNRYNQGSKSEAKTLRLGRLRLEKSFFAKVREVKAGKNFLAKVRLG